MERLDITGSTEPENNGSIVFCFRERKAFVIPRDRTQNCEDGNLT